MNTILTDDEIAAIQTQVLADFRRHVQEEGRGTASPASIARAVEAAVLAKLAQQADRQRVPDGWKLVPVEPTQEMLKELGNAWEGVNRATWQWVIAAAPEAPALKHVPLTDERIIEVLGDTKHSQITAVRALIAESHAAPEAPAEARYFEQYPGQPIEEIDEQRFNRTPEDCRFKLYTAAPEAPVHAVVPAPWREFVAEVVASAESYERRTGQAVNAEWVKRGKELLAAAPEAPAQAEQVPKAWMHEEDPSRVISDVQKQQAIRDGGASASSVRPYSIALVAPEAPAQAEQAAEPVRDELVTALAECRDAFPVPPHGSPLEREWCSAMAKPLCVPDYVRAAVASTERQPLTDERIDEICNEVFQKNQHTCGALIARAIERAHGISAALAQKGGDA